MKKKNIYMKALEKGFEESLNGISFNEMVEFLDLKFIHDNSTDKINFVIWFYSNFFNELVEGLIMMHNNSSSGAHSIQAQVKNGSFDRYYDLKSFIKGESYNKYLDYLELKHARRSSFQATLFSSIAVLISAIALYFQINSSKITLSNDVIDTSDSLLNDSLKTYKKTFIPVINDTMN